MSARTTLRPQVVVNAGDMSGNITSSPTILQSLTRVAYSVDWTGSPVGTFQVQTSNDYALNPNGTVANAGNWATIPLIVNGVISNTVSTVGFTGGMIDVEGISAYAIKLVYTAGSSTGVLTAVIAGKVS